ncbi:stem cell self-renewal protein Piwi domain-containing protein, partial [Acinetobacter baumannii]|nr:stem cell self-renewal protein Piwi domain-containing protein [Acinetobacter baumannii]
MFVELNAFPIDIRNIGIVEACEVPYDKEVLYSLHDNPKKDYHAIRNGNQILIFSNSKNYPIQGTIKEINLAQDY